MGRPATVSDYFGGLFGVIFVTALMYVIWYFNKSMFGLWVVPVVGAGASVVVLAILTTLHWYRGKIPFFFIAHH